MDKLILVLIIVLLVISVAQIAKMYQITGDLSKKREEDVSPTANKINANLLLLFMIGLFVAMIWQMIAFKDVLLPVAASEHGVLTDRLFNINWLILIPAFFIVNFLLFFFAWKYRYDKNRKALYLAHNNTLEMVWTIIPSIVLVFIIIYGLLTWNNIMDDPADDALYVELYSKQFDWTARYAGNDDVMGEANFSLISTQNPLGLITEETVKAKIDELNDEIAKLEKKLEEEIMPESKVKDTKDRIGMRTRQRARVINYLDSGINFSGALDDQVIRGEFHIPVGREVNFQIRSRDVIHSAYMPHFRAQMNAVPGMITQFKFVPTITTDSMRTVLGDEEFNYVLLCNKVCGSAHYNMQMDIIVDSPTDYQKWIDEQGTFAASIGIEIENSVADEEEVDDSEVEKDSKVAQTIK
ncbi:MAG: cytochrome c oxidase subunit II [Cryomorphaceae bacterium]|nr:cytochrome c oxidase subunit II [Flavobacteriales bacterium]